MCYIACPQGDTGCSEATAAAAAAAVVANVSLAMTRFLQALTIIGEYNIIASQLFIQNYVDYHAWRTKHFVRKYCTVQCAQHTTAPGK
jgi:hypothetical protein